MTLTKLTDHLDAICEQRDDLVERQEQIAFAAWLLKERMARLAAPMPGLLGTPEKES